MLMSEVGISIGPILVDFVKHDPIFLSPLVTLWSAKSNTIPILSPLPGPS